MVGNAPAQLLRHLVAQGLAALGVVGAHIDVDESPRVVVAHLAAQAVHLIVGAVHRHHGGAVHGGADDLAPLQVGGDEDHGAQAGAGGVGGDAARQVAGRGAGDGLEPELAGLGGRHRHHPVLEGIGRVDAVVLDVEVVQAQLLAQVAGLEQWGEAGHDVHRVVAAGREQVVIAPDAQGPGGDAVMADHLGNGGVVVHHLQGPEAEVTNVEGLAGVLPAALAAPQSTYERQTCRYLLFRVGPRFG